MPGCRQRSQSSGFQSFLSRRTLKNLGSKTSVATSSPTTAVPAEICLAPLPELKPAPTCQLSCTSKCFLLYVAQKRLG